MKPDRMHIPIFIAQPGSEKEIVTKGLQVEAFIDTAAEISMFPLSIVECVYKGATIPYGLKRVLLIKEIHEFRSVPLTIGVKTIDNNVFCAQVDCIVNEDNELVLVGNDVFKQLGLKVTFDYEKNKILLQAYNWQTFEEEVAAIYRSLGAKVSQNVNLAGFQIDVMLEETTTSKQRFRLAVECKYFKERVGNRVVNDFARVVHTLKDNKLIDKGVLVSASGFTQDAHLVAEKAGIELLTIDDLRQILAERGITPATVPIPHPQRPFLQQIPEKKREWKVFIAMPFSPELDDVYYLGIREIVAKLGGVCERADEMEYVGGVVEKIYDSIKTADIVIGEITIPNPNVYYEIGFAHALGKPVILLTKNVENTPFDLRGYRHVIYSSITELRNRLEGLLCTLMQLDN